MTVNIYFSRIASQMASDIPKPDNGSFKSYLNNPITNNFNFKPVSESDIHSIITNLNSKTSSGHDQISLILLKKLKNVLVTPITVIVNQFLKTGIFPDALKIAKILPVFKKGDTHLIQNYRPISLLPSISKIFEKTVLIQLHDFLTQNNILYTSQYGFRQNHSTEFAALETIV